MYGCASCGKKDVPGGFFFLHDLTCMQYTCDEKREWQLQNKMKIQIPIEDGRLWKSVCPWHVRSNYQFGTKIYHLHPELITGHGDKPMAYICNKCSCYIGDDICPKHSTRYIDFGNYSRIGIEEPTILEKAVLAQYQLYRKVIKIERPLGQYTLRSHMVLFDHDAPSNAAQSFSEKNVDDIIFVFLTEDGKNHDVLVRETFGSSRFRCRPYVIYQWLSVLRCINPNYFDIDLPDIENLQRLSNNILNKLRSSAIQEKLPPLAHVGDDVARVRESGDSSNGVPSVYVCNPTDDISDKTRVLLSETNKVMNTTKEVHVKRSAV